MCVGSLAGVTYLLCTVLTSPKKGETVVHCCDPALSVLVMLVPRNVFHIVSALQSIEYGFSAVLVINRESIFCTLVLNWVSFLEETTFSLLSIRPSSKALYKLCLGQIRQPQRS